MSGYRESGVWLYFASNCYTILSALEQQGFFLSGMVLVKFRAYLEDVYNFKQVKSWGFLGTTDLEL